MTEPQYLRDTEVSSASKERLFFLASLALAALVAVYFYYKSHTAAATTSEANLALEKENANMLQELQDLRAAKLSLQEHQQVAKSKLVELEAEYNSVAATLDILQSRIEDWQKSADGALDSELGKRIASDPQLLKEYEAIIAQKMPSPEIARQLRARLGELKVPLESAKELKDGSYGPTEQFVMTIAMLKKEAEDAAQAYLDQQSTLNALLDRAPSTPAETTLRAALVERKKREDEERARLLAAELEKARKEIAEEDAKTQADNERRIAAAERDKNRRITDAEEKRMAEEAALTTATIAAETAKTADQRKAAEAAAQAELAQVQLERDFENDLNEIKSLLRPMIVEGKTQPGNNRQLERVAATGPISLSRLRGAGTLDGTQRGVDTLHYMFGAGGHDRDLGSFPRCGAVAGKAEEELAWRAQELLIKYGDLMVKKKMLAE